MGLTGGRGGEEGAAVLGAAAVAVATVVGTAVAAGGALCGTVGMGTGLLLEVVCEAGGSPARVPVGAEGAGGAAARAVVALALLLFGGA